jgi:hypothetical protein
VVPIFFDRATANPGTKLLKKNESKPDSNTVKNGTNCYGSLVLLGKTTDMIGYWAGDGKSDRLLSFING